MESNWLSRTAEKIASEHPETHGCSRLISERLAAVLLERLPRNLSVGLLELLPESVWRHSWALQSSARGHEERSIGYADFLDRTRRSIACIEYSDLSGTTRTATDLEQLCIDVCDSFLKGVATEIPSALRIQIAEALPAEIRHRMFVGPRPAAAA